jgi:hypothetical protein
MKKEKHMNKDARAFIINLAVADLCVSGIADPMCIAGVLNYFADHFVFLHSLYVTHVLIKKYCMHYFM